MIVQIVSDGHAGDDLVVLHCYRDCRCHMMSALRTHVEHRKRGYRHLTKAIGSNNGSRSIISSCRKRVIGSVLSATSNCVPNQRLHWKNSTQIWAWSCRTRNCDTFVLGSPIIRNARARAPRRLPPAFSRHPTRRLSSTLGVFINRCQICKANNVSCERVFAFWSPKERAESN